MSNLKLINNLLCYKKTWTSTIQSFHACILLPSSLKPTLLYNAARTTFGSHLPGLLPPKGSDPWLNRLESPSSAASFKALYFTSIAVSLISRLWSHSLGCELKHWRHTTFPWMAVISCCESPCSLVRSPAEGSASLRHPSLKTGKIMGVWWSKGGRDEQDFTNSNYCWREQFLKASSQKRKWTWLFGSIHKYESQTLIPRSPLLKVPLIKGKGQNLLFRSAV